MKTLLISLLFSVALSQAVDLSSISGNDQNNSIATVDEQKSVFGSHLFSGNFTKASQHIYNPDYRLAIGDVVTVFRPFTEAIFDNTVF